MSSEVEIEPIPGLPEALPAGERILWQGRPDWRRLARDTFEVRWLGAYFAIFIALRGLFALQAGRGVLFAVETSAVVVPLAALCIGLLSLLAYLHARATIYTITTRRVVMRFGVALPMTFNLPFKRLAEASLLTRKDGSGDIALRLVSPDRIAWLHLWPHARPWHLAKAQPMLRALPDAAAVATILGDAVRATAAQEAQAVPMAGAAPPPLRIEVRALDAAEAHAASVAVS